MQSQDSMVSVWFTPLFSELPRRLRQENHWKFEASWANNEFQGSLGYGAEWDYILNIKQNIEVRKRSRPLHLYEVEGEDSGGGAVFSRDNRDRRQKNSWPVPISPFPNPISESRDRKDFCLQASTILFILLYCSASWSTREIQRQKQKLLTWARYTELLCLLLVLAFPTLLFPFLLFHSLHLPFCSTSSRTSWCPPAIHK